jgi:hypothetical protein
MPKVKKIQDQLKVILTDPEWRELNKSLEKIRSKVK